MTSPNHRPHPHPNQPQQHAHHPPHHHPPGVRPGPAEWDARYREQQRIWSGEPNHALVTEVDGLASGRALDVGCGEGADAVWLAQRGWQVVGIDPSGVALERARSAATAAGLDITWLHAELAEVAGDLDDAAFDIVTACYATLFIDSDPLATLARLVAPGGSLLVVHHADVDPEQARAHGFDPAELLSPADVAAGLDQAWRVVVDERRPRVIHGGSGAHHADDLVVRAVRRH
ncbi:MAG: class I SAM-dependent methyltransferase [Dermatophilaceae bacterium]